MVKNLLSILAARQNSILSGASIIMLTMFASKFLGLVKDRMMVHFFDGDGRSGHEAEGVHEIGELVFAVELALGEGPMLERAESGVKLRFGQF